jgi:hypothetical protein
MLCAIKKYRLINKKCICKKRFKASMQLSKRPENKFINESMENSEAGIKKDSRRGSHREKTWKGNI